jgi:hypothetical protein
VSLDPRALLAERLRDTAEGFEKGNQRAWRLARRTLSALVTLVSDTDILLAQSVFAVSNDFFDTQTKAEGGKEFLRELGGTLRELSDALKGNESGKIDSVLRKFVTQVNVRWLEVLKQGWPE